jgi:hypothetical protein
MKPDKNNSTDILVYKNMLFLGFSDISYEIQIAASGFSSSLLCLQ